MSDKLLEQYPIKVSPTLKHNLTKLSELETKTMLNEVRVLMARHIHNSAAVFDSSLYLDEQEGK